MPEVFLTSDVKSLLRNKSVALMGCSNVRALYKDLVCLVQSDQLISNNRLRAKMEPSHMGDCLVCHGKKHNGRDYREERLYQNDNVTISYFFLTRVFGDYVRSIVTRLAHDPPDVVIISSCLWDITRWGPNGVEEFKKNLSLLFREICENLPRHCQILWLTTAPLAQEVKGGFLIPQLDFLQYSLRFHVLEANFFCRQVADKFGVDVVDLHYHLRSLLDLRADDGIHWLPLAVRLGTNLILTHIALSWNAPLPSRGGFLTETEREIRDISGAEAPKTEENERTLPVDLSYGVLFGDDRQLMNEMVNNATENAPSGSSARVGRGEPWGLQERQYRQAYRYSQHQHQRHRQGHHYGYQDQHPATPYWKD